MKAASRISKKYHIRQILACWLACLMFFGIPVQVALAGPKNPKVVAGRAGIGQKGNATTVNMRSSRAVINWDSLNTSSSEILQFLKASGGFAVLNRVVKGGATQFNGSLFGNQGHIVIVNPQGIVFGPTALVQAYKFTASALDISDTDFMNGVYNFAGGGVGKVANYGKISAEQVALIGKSVLNAGVIRSPRGYVLMAAGDRVFLGQEGSNVVVEVDAVTVPQDSSVPDMGDVINEGVVEAAGGKIVLAAGDTFSRAIDGLESMSLAVESGTGRVGQFGTLNADGVDGDGGSITLTAGDMVALGADSVTTANGGANGDGGEVIVYSPDTAVLDEGARIEAKGGSISGDGGFVEISGKESISVMGTVDTRAANGQAGMYLLDPWNWTISDNPQSLGNYNTTKLANDLLLSNITLSATGWSILGMGWIIVQDALTYNSANELALNASNYIWTDYDAPITNEGAGALKLRAQKDITINAEISLNGGHLEMLGGQSGGLFGLGAAADIRINENITAGSMRIKNGKDVPPGEQSYSGVYLADDKNLTATAGDVIIEAVHDVVLGGDVLAAGDIFINGDEDGYGDPRNVGLYHPRAYGGGDVIARNLTAGGNIEVKGNAIRFNGDVSANGGDLTITGRTSKEEGWHWVQTGKWPWQGYFERDHTLINDSHWGQVQVGPDRTLYAYQNVDIVDAGVGVAGGNMTLTGENSLTIAAETGTISAPDTIIQVLGSELTMEQGPTLNTADFLFANQDATHLTLISNNGSVISTDEDTAAGKLFDGDNDNAADQWASIGATANGGIILSGHEYNIKARRLEAAHGPIEVDAKDNDILANDHGFTDDDGILASGGGNVTLKGDNVIVVGDIDAHHGGGIRPVGYNSDLTVEAKDNIEIDGYANIDGDMVLQGNLSSSGTGNVTAHGDLIAGGSIDIYSSDSTTYLGGDLIEATDNITLHNNTILDGSVSQRIDAVTGTLTAKNDVKKTTWGGLTMGGGSGIYIAGDVTSDYGSLTFEDNVTANGAGDQKFESGALRDNSNKALHAKGSVTKTADNGGGSLTLKGEWRTVVNGDITVEDGGLLVEADQDIQIDGSATSSGDMVLTADADKDAHLPPLNTGNVFVFGNLTSTGGSITVSGYDETIYLGGDASAFTDVLLNNNTRFIGFGDQHVTAETGTITAKGWLDKSPYWRCLDYSSGSLYLRAEGDISLADYVTAGLPTDLPEVPLDHFGGVSIISDSGKIFTPGFGSTLNVAITGNSNHLLGTGVDLPKNYDDPVEDTGKAAIVVMSKKTLKLGPGAELTAGGVYDPTGAVDDRPGVDFLDHPEGDKNPGWPIDIAIYLASNSGNVFVGSPVNPIGKGGAMIVDAFDTVKSFGSQFISSLAAGNVGWLEVCSRITPTLNHAVINNTLPYASDLSGYPGKGRYVLRGEHPDVGTGAWVLASNDEPPYGEAVAIGTEEQTLGTDGCPVLLAAVAEELGVPEDTIEVSIENSLALSTDIHPCESCARLVDAATILRDEDGSRMAAMVQVFNQLAPPEAPFTPEMASSIVTAFAGHVGDGTQYATAIEYIDAFVGYIAVLDTEMGSPVGDSTVFVMEKHGEGIAESENSNIAAFVASRLASLETFGG
jgi:filamentous hemagglutinin family protein